MQKNPHSDEPISPLMVEFSSYIATALRRKLPPEVGESMKIHLVDTFAAMISGSRLLPGRRGIAYVKPLVAAREAGVVGTRIVTSALNAALANGMCAHADETDDVHAATRAHPGASMVPATLAVAEHQHASGESILRALVLGYDISTRVLLALKDTQLRKLNFHPSSKGCLIGSAAAASALLKLDAHKIRYVISYCVEQAAGLFAIVRDSQHNEKAYVVGGMTARNGVMAAQLVASGFTGVEDIFSGDSNFLSVYSRDADPDALVRGLGREYSILDCGIKFWPAGGPIQGPLHVLRELMREHRFKAGDVEKLVARMPDKELDIVNNRDMPDINVQHLLAVLLLDGKLTFATTHDFARMKDPKVLKLRRDRIECIGDAGLTDPMRSWRCIMEVTLKDGRKLSHQTMSAKGSAQNPLTREEEEEKALDLMAPVMGKKRSQALMSALFNLERIKDATALRKLYDA